LPNRHLTLTLLQNPAHNCSFDIRAAAYNWNNPAVGDWYLENVLYPSLVHCDGIWLDGNGYDNGAWMCSGFCCGYGAQNSPQVRKISSWPRSWANFSIFYPYSHRNVWVTLPDCFGSTQQRSRYQNQSMIDGFTAAQLAITTKGRQHIIASGGYDFNCFQYKVEEMPMASDTATTCGDKVLSMSAWAANHSNYDMVVAYGGDEGGQGGYNDSTFAGAVAAFMIVRGKHWLFSMGESK
jgi:hypothetical protein